MAAWYREGTVTVSNGSTAVVGALTAWLNQVRAGDPFHGPDGRLYEIGSVDTNTAIELVTPYLGDSASGQDYAIQRRTPEWTFSTELATKVNEIIARRSLILHGNGAPSDTLGEDGYFYIDETANALYGPKADGAWPSPVSLVGSDAGFRYVWSTEPTGSPSVGEGQIRANGGSPGAEDATIIEISEVDGDGNNIATEIASWALSTSAVKCTLYVRKANTPGSLLRYDVTAGVDNGASFQLTVQGGLQAGTLDHGDVVYVMAAITGDAGDDGADGTDPGFLFTYETLAVLATGWLRADNVIGSATTLYVSKTTRGGSDVAARLLELSPGSPGKTEPNVIILTDPVTEAQASFRVDGVVDQSGYVEIAVSGHAGVTAFSAGAISLQREISGADGVAPGSRNSIEVDAGELQLVGDTPSPGNNKVYGTDASGNRGFKDDPAGGDGIGKNAVINGSMRIAQRGTSFTSTGSANNDDVYVLDRWNLLSDGNDIVDVTQATDAPAAALFSMGLDVETVNKKFGILQIIEQNNCADLIGQTVVLSAYLKVTNATRLDKIKMAIVAWDGAADTVTSDIISAWGADGTNPTLVANWTYENTPADLGVTTSWARYSVSAVIDTAAAKNVGVVIWSDNVTDTDLGDFLYVANVKLERGSTPTAFETPSIVDELDECLRYYIRQVAPGAGTRIGNGTALTTTNASVLLPNLRLRTSPTLFGTAGLTIADAGSNLTVTGLSLNWSGSTLQVGATVASGLTAGDAVQLRLAATSDYFEIMCEL